MILGFSLIEIILAIGILGGTLTMLLSSMADFTYANKKQIDTILLLNTQRNVQNFLNKIPKALTLDSDDLAYCGYKSKKFTISNNQNDLDIRLAILLEKQTQPIANSNASLIIYEIHNWDITNTKAYAQTQNMKVSQSAILSAFTRPQEIEALEDEPAESWTITEYSPSEIELKLR